LRAYFGLDALMTRVMHCPRAWTLALALIPLAACPAPEVDDDTGAAPTSGGSGGETETDGETDGFDPLCFEDPVADAGFSVDLGTWPIPADRDDHYEIDAPCTVLEVQDDGVEIRTSLECDVDGALHTMALHTAATPEGGATWAAGLAVRFHYLYDFDWELHELTYRGVTLRRAADDALLVGAIDSDGLEFSDFLGRPGNHFLAPVVATDDFTYCGGVEDVYAIGLRGSEGALSILAAVEHRSTPEPLLPLRAYWYAGSLWERHVAQHGPRVRRIPMILPIVLVQHPMKWNGPSRLSDLYEGPAALREQVRAWVDLELIVDDMSETVLDDPVARFEDLALVELTRGLMVAYHRPDVITGSRIESWAVLFDAVLCHHPEDAKALWTYVVSVFPEGSGLRPMLIAAVGKENRDMVRTIKDAWLAEGRVAGLGGAVLEHRGLPVSDEIRERVLATRDEAGLQRWLRRAVTAGSLEQVFEPSV